MSLTSTAQVYPTSAPISPRPLATVLNLDQPPAGSSFVSSPALTTTHMSSLSRKRSRAASQDGDAFRIKTAAGDPLPAKSLLVRTFSTCAEQLPAGAEEWDVSGFLIEGEPFSRETVKAWLNCGYSMLYGPAEVDAEDQAHLSTARGLHQVLTFAHAVGSPAGLLKAACSQLHELRVEVQLAASTLELPISPAHDCSYRLAEYEEGCQLVTITLTGRTVLGQVSTMEEVQDIRQQVAEQTAALLEVAHVLHLQPLIDALHRFIRMSTWLQNSIFAGMLDQLFNDAVLEAALGSSTVRKEAYISSALTQPCSLVSSALSSQGLLKPVGEFKVASDTGKVYVQAQLLRDFAGGKAGQTVHAALDLFAEDGLALGLQLQLDDQEPAQVWFAARLLLGNSIGSDGQLALV